MKSRAMLSLVLLSLGCRASAPSSSGVRSVSELTTSRAACEETCGGEYATANLVGCVVGCDTWSSDKVTVVKGHSIYALRKSEPGCGFVYTKRDSNQIRSSTGIETFSYSFSYTKGIGDGDFLIIGSGMTEQVNLMDFTKAEDKKEIKTAGSTNAMTALFIRKDAAHSERPTFSLTGNDKYSAEFKQLTVVMDDDFDPKQPFKKILSTSFQVKKDSEIKHEIECGR
ncbi:MAG: hypothetical protein NTY08_18145 [Proteobacteria bacterium]|nr:hypothetical protein [Pseudomonadota bacterium]